MGNISKYSFRIGGIDSCIVNGKGFALLMK
jgi:hypothetical protein